MIKKLTYLKSNIDKAQFFSLLLLIFMLPIYRQLTSLLIALLAVLTFIKFLYYPKTKWTRPFFLFLFILPYLLIVPGYFFSENKTESLFDITVKLSIFILPLFLSFSPMIWNDARRIKWAIYAFISGCVIGTIICLVHAAYMFVKTDYWYYVFYYVNLSILYHPSYYAMILNFAIALLLFVTICKRYQISKRERTGIAIIIFYFLVFIILLNSKAGIISTGITFLIFVFYIIFSRKRAILGISLLAGLAALISLLVILIPSSTSRFTEALNAMGKIKHTDKSTIDGSSERLFIWKYAYELSLQHPLTGFGNGDAKNKLVEVYKKEGLVNAYNQKLNAHNQFLQITIAAGFPGLLSFLLALFLPFFLPKNKNVILYYTFIILIIINFLVESMLETQSGVVFYSVFNAVLFFNIYSKGNNPNTHSLIDNTNKSKRKILEENCKI